MSLAGKPGLGDATREGRGPAVGPVLAADAQESKAAIALIQQVLGADPSDGLVVDVNDREGEPIDDAQHVDGGHAHRCDGARHPLVLDPGDDPVAAPAP